MAKENHISFEDWVEWVFNRDDSEWVWKGDNLSAKWLRNTKLIAEHFVQLHCNSVRSLCQFTNNQIGLGLGNLYSAIVGLCPVDGNGISTDLHHEMIRSLLMMMRQLLPERVPHNETFFSDEISTAVYMFWDSASMSPFKPTDADKALFRVCLEEMQHALYVKHPAAQMHALHGLGENHYEIPSVTQEIIDRWLATNPHILPSVTKYAQRARVGLVQ